MATDGQVITKQAYEDPELVDHYIQRNVSRGVDDDSNDIFIQNLTGNNVLDLGCGPGHYSYRMSEKALEVTGLDYSQEMIRKAQRLRQIENIPGFMVGDMLKLEDYFEQNTFDGIWANASLLHIRKEDINTVLKGIRAISKNRALVYISLKAGAGTVMETTDKYGKPTAREFTLWDKDSFVDVATQQGLVFKDLLMREGYTFLGEPTVWLRFLFTITK